MYAILFFDLFIYLANKKTLEKEVPEATAEYNRTILLDEQAEKQYSKFALVLWRETGEHSVTLSSLIPDKKLLEDPSLKDYMFHGASSEEQEFSVVKLSGKF